MTMHPLHQPVCPTVPCQEYTGCSPRPSLDHAHWNLFLFPKMKLKLTGKRFSILDIKLDSQQVLMVSLTHTHTHKDSSTCFQQWQSVGLSVLTPKGNTLKGEDAKLGHLNVSFFINTFS
jgi:hypothetical protein